MTILLGEVAGLVGDASDLAKAGTIGVLSVGLVVVCWVAWKMYKRGDTVQAEAQTKIDAANAKVEAANARVAALQEQRVKDAKEYASSQQSLREDAIGVATLAVEALQRQPQVNEAMVTAMSELEERDLETHRLIESTMKLVEDRSKRR